MDSNQDFGSVLNNFSNSSQPQQSNDSFGRVLSGYGRSSQQAPADPANIDEFVKSVAPAAQRVASKLGVPVEAVIGQWGLETGWGRSVIPGTNNLGNIKSTDGRGVAATDNATGSRDAYRQYGSVDEFADDFANLVGNGRYKAVSGSRDAQSYFQNLQSGGYAEDKNYVQVGTKASSMAAEALKRAGVAPAQQSPSGPDLSKAPKWADVEGKAEFKALSPEKQAEAKAAYFDYWIAPRAGERGSELRQKFLAKTEPGFVDKALGVAKDIGGAIVDAVTPAKSVMEGQNIPAAPDLPTTSRVPVKPEVRAAFQAQWDAATPEQRTAMAEREDWVGMLAKERAGVFERSDANNLKSMQAVDPRIEARVRALVAKGENPEFAERAAREAAAAGVAPGREVEFITKKYGTINKSDFDFDTKQLFDQKGGTNGLNNPLSRGLTKGALGVGKAVTGYGEFLADAMGLDNASKTMREGGNWTRGKEQAIGESGSFMERNFEGAISSIAQQLPLLITGTKLESEAVPLAGMAMQSFGQEYSDGRAAGQSVGEATTRASIFAAFEVIGEKFGLKENMQAIKAAARGLPSDQIVGFLWSALKKEVPGELLTTTGQFGTDKLPGGVGLNPNATGADYLKQVADTVAQTIMQSGLMAGGTTGVSKAVQFARDKGPMQGVADADAELARQQALNKWNTNGLNSKLGDNAPSMAPDAAPAATSTTPDGRIEPTLDGTLSVTPAEPAGAPAIHPTSQTADDIVRELATEAGIPHETVLPVQPPQIPQDEATPDQDVLDFAATRYQQLRQKRDGTRQTVMGETGPADQDMPGVGLTPAEQQEMDGLQRANGDVNLLRAQYGFDQPPTPENQSVETQTQEQPQGIGPAPSQDAIVSDGQPSGAASVQEPAADAFVPTDDQQHAVRESGQQAGTVQAEAPLTVPLSERSDDELRAQLRSASDRGIQRAIGEELARRKKEAKAPAPEPVKPPAPPKTKTEKAAKASKEDLEHLFGVPQKREKALARIAKGTAFFGNEAKAKEFITSNGLKDTHEVVKSPKGTRWDIVAKKQHKEEPNGIEAPQAVEATQEGPQTPAAEPVDAKAATPVPEAAPTAEGGLPDAGRTDAVEAAGLPPRGREGYDTPVTLDAASLKALVEKTRGTPLVDKPEKLEAWRNGTAKTDPAKFPIELAITPDGRLDVNDGRHRIALAAERGETVEAFIDGKDAHYAQQLVSQPSQPTGAPNVPQAAQAQQSIAQSTQARGAATAGPAAAAETVPAAPGIANVEAAGPLSNVANNGLGNTEASSLLSNEKQKDNEKPKTERAARIASTLKNGGYVVGDQLRMSNGLTQMRLTPDELAGVPDASKREAPDPEKARITPKTERESILQRQYADSVEKYNTLAREYKTASEDRRAEIRPLMDELDAEQVRIKSEVHKLQMAKFAENQRQQASDKFGAMDVGTKVGMIGHESNDALYWEKTGSDQWTRHGMGSGTVTKTNAEMDGVRVIGAKPKTEKEAKAKREDANASNEKTVDIGGEKPLPKTYLNVPFASKDFAKARGAKWDAENKLWFAEPIATGMAAGEFNINLKSFVVQDTTDDERYNFYDNKDVARVVALNKSQRTGIAQVVKKTVHADGVHGWKVIVATDEASKPKTEREARAAKQSSDASMVENSSTNDLDSMFDDVLAEEVAKDKPKTERQVKDTAEGGVTKAIENVKRLLRETRNKIETEPAQTADRKAQLKQRELDLEKEIRVLRQQAIGEMDVAPRTATAAAVSAAKNIDTSQQPAQKAPKTEQAEAVTQPPNDGRIFGMRPEQLGAKQKGGMSDDGTWYDKDAKEKRDAEEVAARKELVEKQKAENAKRVDDATTDPRIKALQDAGIPDNQLLQAAKELKEGDDSLVKDLARITGVSLPESKPDFIIKDQAQFSDAPQSLIDRMAKNEKDGTPAMLMLGGGAHGKYTLYEPGNRTHYSHDWRVLQGESSSKDVPKVALRYKSESDIVAMTNAAKLQMDETAAEIEAQKQADEKARAEREAATAKEQADKAELRNRLASVKFKSEEIPITTDKGVTKNVKAYTYQGAAVHKTHLGEGKKYQITHIKTSKHIGASFDSLADAKLAAARLAQATNLNEITGKEGIEHPGFKRLLETAQAMRGDTTWASGNPLNNPELSLSSEPFLAPKTEKEARARKAVEAEKAKPPSRAVIVEQDDGIGNITVHAQVDLGKGLERGFSGVDSVDNARKMLELQGVPSGAISVRKEVFDPKLKKFVTNKPQTEREAKARKVEEPQTFIDQEAAFWNTVNSGGVGVDKFKASFERWILERQDILVELMKLKKDDLLKLGGPSMAYRYKSETKPEIASGVWREFASRYTLGRSFSYGMGKDSYIQAIRSMVNATDADQLAKHASEIKEAQEEAIKRRAAKAEAVKDPQTLDDYMAVMSVKVREQGMTYKEARMSLTPEQRATFDSLNGEKTRSERKDTKEEKTSVRVAGQRVDASIIETKHTQKGHDLFVVQLSERVSRDDYETLNTDAKKMGGYYSSFRGRGAVAGFQFKDKPTAEAFVKLANGDSTDAQAAVETRRDAFADDKSQTAVERLREMAQRMDDKATESLSADRKANTERRARFAAAAESAANSDKAMAKTMRNIADAIASGTAKFLDRVRQKVQVEALQQHVSTANYSYLREKYPSYADFEKHQHDAPIAEVADFAEFPAYTANRSDLASLGRQLLAVDGTKLLGQRLMKVADDVTDAWSKFAKENTGKLMAYRAKDGGLAAFGSKDDAQRSIDGSGYHGKAVPFMVKRGEYTIILSPSAAIERGIWGGDGDKRITLSPEFGAELVEKIGKAARKGSKVSVPWQFESAYDKRAVLARMGIETPAEFRAALREFIGLKEAPQEISKVKQLERAMVGRKNDGLDFFPTPESTADEMIAAADLQEGMSVLEPSAGWGHIAERIRQSGVDPDVVEMSEDRRELLEAKGFRLIGRDFLDINPREFFTFGDTFKAEDGTEGVMRGLGGLGSNRVRLVVNGDESTATYHDRDSLVGVKKNGADSGYDRIIMNPPFSDGRDMEHVRHAYNLLKPGGRVVAIMGESAFTNQNKKASAFRDWLESVGGTDEKLAEGTFMDAGLPVNTGANARMVVIEKGSENETPKFNRKDDNSSDETGIKDNSIDTQRAIEMLERRFGRAYMVSHPVEGWSTDETKAVAPIAQAFGSKVVGYKVRPENKRFDTWDMAGSNGAQAVGHIFLNVESGRPHLSILGHETAHEMRKRRPDLYAKLVNAIESYVDKDKYSNVFRNSKVGRGSLRDGMTPDQVEDSIQEEFIGEVLSDGFMDAGFWRALGQKNKQLLAQVWAFVGKILGKVMGLGGTGYTKRTEQYLNDYAKVMQIAGEVMAEYGMNPSTMAKAMGVPVFNRWVVDLTKTPEFKRWFGDSKVVDKDGKPLLVYHGTTKSFYAFITGTGWFTSDPGEANFWGGMNADGANVVPAYLSIKNPRVLQASEASKNKILDALESLQNDEDGVIVIEDGQIRWAVVVEPTQIKSAIGNNGQFDPQNPDIRFNRKDTPADITRRTQNNLIQFFGNRDKSPSLKTFGAYDKTLSTQFNKALKDKHYGKVFGLANAMQNEVSLTSIRPAELAPGVLPRVDDVKSAFKQLVKGKKHDKNLDVAASAIFDGTLDGDSVMTGKIWTKIEFMARPGATETAWALYQQARAAIDASLDEVAAAEAYAMAQGFIPKGMRREIIDAPQQAKNLVTGEITKQINMLNKAIKAAAKMGAAEQEAELVAARAEYDSIQSQVERIFDTAENLKAAGYAPLMRFGKFTVTAQAFDHETGRVMRDENGESITLFHSSYETEGEAKAVRAQLEAKYEGQNVRVAAGAKSQSSHELYAGISPETLALFAEAIGADAAMRKHIELAMSERSALKRRLERKGIEGYSEDMPRVLSNFITSNGRHAAQRYYLRDLNNAIKYIPKEKGDVLDEAIALKKFIVNPNDPAAPVSTVMFAWFLGGSVASAAVNLTQPIMMTAPYLSQFGVSTATKAMAKAMPYAMGKKEINDAEMRSALNRASQEGIVDAQEIFHLYSVGAQGVASGLVNTLAKIPGIGGKIKAGSEDARARANAFLTLWGSMFALAEGFNRKLTFIAAWEVAKENGEKNPYAFAVRAVNETQGIYNKVNRPNWARGAVGRTVLTFKQFSLMYVELLNRMVRHGGPEGKRAALIMLAVLMLAAGEEGIPFAQDLDDLIDTIGQGFGLDTNMKRNKRRVAHEILGKQLGDMFLYGVSSQLPMDFGGRLGLGNMIPGTALLKPSDENTRGRNLAEVMGAAAGLGQQVGDAYDAMVEGNKAKALQNLAPKAVKDVLAGGEMAKKGYSTDAKGRKVVDVGLGDAAFKGIGFNPTKVAQETRKTMPVYQDIALQKATEASIVSKWARGIADNDQEMVKEAQDKWNKWNKDNPDTPISIKPDQIRNQVKSLGNDKDSRILKSAPKEMRRGVGLELAR